LLVLTSKYQIEVLLRNFVRRGLELYELNSLLGDNVPVRFAEVLVEADDKIRPASPLSIFDAGSSICMI
jgi:hypothetical protein